MIDLDMSHSDPSKYILFVGRLLHYQVLSVAENLVDIHYRMLQEDS
jgi:hypothetical protein